MGCFGNDRNVEVIKMIRHFNFLTISVLLILITSCVEEGRSKKTDEDTTLISQVDSPANYHSSLPFLFAEDEQLLLSWIAQENDSLYVLKYAKRDQGTWNDIQEIVSGTDWFVNWADYPMIAENQGNLWAHVLKKSSSGTYSYDVSMNLLAKRDSIWNTNVVLHTDGTPTEHGFVTALPYTNGFFVTWLDGRNTEERAGEERGAMTLRAAEVAFDGTVFNEHELDIRTCDCCQTTAAITDNGPIVIYRDRSEDEVRDISIVRHIKGEWTHPQPVAIDGWKIKGCPVNGPRAVASGNNVVVAWFTGAQENPRVLVAFSQDGGATFANPIPIAAGKVLGRVDVDFLKDNAAVVSWMAADETSTSLKALKVSPSGARSKPLVISKMSASRKSGFPQMERLNDSIYFAWTAYTAKNTSIEMAVLPVALFD